MFLVLDVGNTNITVALFQQNQQLIVSWRTATDPRKTADDYTAWLLPLLEKNQVAVSAIHHIVLASVVPDTDYPLKTFLRQLFRQEPMLVTAATAKVEVRLPFQHEVGADRLVNAYAARRLYRAPAIILDFGTATTFDVLDTDGAYIGGVIAPGPNLSLQALYNAAAKLPKIAISRPSHVLGQTTVTAMQSGLYWGYVSLIEGLLRRLQQEVFTGKPEPLVIATGGLARLFADSMPQIAVHDLDLTVKGLALLATDQGTPGLTQHADF